MQDTNPIFHFLRIVAMRYQTFPMISHQHRSRLPRSRITMTCFMFDASDSSIQYISTSLLLSK